MSYKMLSLVMKRSEMRNLHFKHNEHPGIISVITLGVQNCIGTRDEESPIKCQNARNARENMNKFIILNFEKFK
jgi:hypothetical protein